MTENSNTLALMEFALISEILCNVKEEKNYTYTQQFHGQKFQENNVSFLSIYTFWWNSNSEVIFPLTLQVSYL